MCWFELHLPVVRSVLRFICACTVHTSFFFLFLSLRAVHAFGFCRYWPGKYCQLFELENLYAARGINCSVGEFIRNWLHFVPSFFDSMLGCSTADKPKRYCRARRGLGEEWFPPKPFYRIRVRCASQGLEHFGICKRLQKRRHRRA